MIVWIAIAALAVGGLALVLTDDAGTVLGLGSGDFAQLVALGALAAVVGAAVFGRRSGRLPAQLKAAAVWLAIGAALVTAYAFRHDAEAVAQRVLAELVPGIAIEEGGGRVSVARSSNGHFLLDAEVNGASVRMLLDTGASTVVLTPKDAARVGIDISQLVFSAPVWTANGRTEAAPVLLDRVEIGSISLQRVRAMVTRPGALNESLLGMSFLERIPTWRVERDRLILGG
jgi:aspartyl protease family protein